MAGYVVNKESKNSFEFHIDTERVVERILAESDNPRVVTLQLDGDELDAALWGLRFYIKSLRPTVR